MLGALVLNEPIDRGCLGTTLVIGGIALVNMGGRLPFRQQSTPKPTVGDRTVKAHEPSSGDLG